MTYDDLFDWLRGQGCSVRPGAPGADAVVRKGPAAVRVPPVPAGEPADPDVVQQIMIGLRLDPASLPDLTRD